MRLPFVIGFIIIATHRSYVTFKHTHSHPTTSLFPTLHYDVGIEMVDVLCKSQVHADHRPPRTVSVRSVILYIISPHSPFAQW